MVRFLPWPFPDGEFPRELGAVVQVTVLDGELPALLVIHAPEGDWLVGDGLNDPNDEGASVATHIWHAIERNSSMAELASLPPGRQATRRWPGDPWVVSEAERLG